ncbi:putative MFS family arabinose efflux permease [Nonomuraea polychroma]|uniref:Putative MFS family arabinose efflux permease n=1 Tax=Nonomuraea polychroma TaxID=46176 RepID=A0A438LZH7_9ACTN|nr:MFS transporter [Nonomuraea polychroma]RVX38946.1 putative MFS family arabinose efflux permease [Nonomuraea polychroma]
MNIVRFALIWTASLLSSVGSSLTTFVLGVWVYQSTGSPTGFALVVLSGMLPGILIGPFAGVIVDRFDRRHVMIVTDCLAALSTAALAALIWTQALAVWHVALAGAVSGACGAFHLTAYQAMTPLLIPERHLGRANGLMHLSAGIQIAAPVLGATLLATVGMTGVVVLDLATFGVAMSALLLIRLPAAVLRPGAATERPAVLQDLGSGLRHLRARAGLPALVAALTGFNFTFAVAGVLVQPLILSFADPGVLGVLMFAGGAGMLAGGLVMGAWGGPRRKITGMTAFMALGGVFLVLHTLSPSPLLVGLAAAGFLFTLPVVNGCAHAVLQSRIDPAVLGRAMGTVHTLGSAAVPVGYLLAAPVAEHLLNPALVPGGALADSVGLLVGVGEGRGIAFVLLLDGLLLLAMAAVLATLPALRRLEHRPVPVPVA